MDRNTLKMWFRRGLKPLEVQFAAWIDSFWHKDDAIPMSQIENLQETINSKQDKIVTPNVSVWLDTEAYHAADDIYRSYVNPSSPDEIFHTEATYRCKIDTLAGESPETHPEKWVSQGGSVGTIRIESVVDLRAELDGLSYENTAQDASILALQQADVVLMAAINAPKPKQIQFYSTGENSFRFYASEAKTLKKATAENLASVTLDGVALAHIDGTAISVEVAVGFHTVAVTYRPNFQNMTLNLGLE